MKVIARTELHSCRAIEGREERKKREMQVEGKRGKERKGIWEATLNFEEEGKRRKGKDREK